ncbi:MAG: hypothetical protein RR482_02925 [Clostridia bacterium]
MDAWIMWGLGILSSIITGALAFFIKRNVTANDERQKASAGELRHKIDCLESSISTKIERMGQTMEARIDKTDDRIGKLEDRFNGLIKEIPVGYVDKESWLMQNQTIDRKLDKITEILMNQGRAQ